MRTLLLPALLFLMLFPVIAWAQTSAVPDSRLNRLTGNRVPEGTIDGQKTVHDITARRVPGGTDACRAKAQIIFGYKRLTGNRIPFLGCIFVPY